MSRLRLLWLAGAIAILVLLALSRPCPLARAATALPSTAIPPRVSVSRVPVDPVSLAVQRDQKNARRAEMLRSGRFAELLRSTLEPGDEEEQARWLATCAQLAPPRLLAAHALRLPAGSTREALLDVAIDRWVIDAPIEAGTWIATHLDDDPCLDFALARIVEHTDTIQRPTASALKWVNLIHTPALRFRALQAVVREWAESDPDAAFRFAETTTGLSANEHASLLLLFLPPIPET